MAGVVRFCGNKVASGSGEIGAAAAVVVISNKNSLSISDRTGEQVWLWRRRRR